MIPVPHLHEQLLAARLLIESGGKTSRALDAFAGWLLVGSAAFLAFLLAHQVIRLDVHSRSGWLLVIAALGTVVQKYLALLVASIAESYRIGREAGDAYLAAQRAEGGPVEFNITAYYAYVLAALFPLQRRLARPFLEKAARGDFLAGARFALKLGEVQGMIVLIDALLIICALAICLFMNQ